MREVIFIYFLILVTSCGEDILPNHELTNCLAAEISENLIQNQCLSTNIDSSQFCNKIVVDETYSFSQEQKKWLPTFCCLIGESISYMDTLGKISYIYLQDKRFFSSSIGVNGFDDCDSLSSKHNFYCLNQERMWTKQYIEILDLQVGLDLKIEYERPFSNPPKSGVSLRISTTENYSTIEYASTHFYGILDFGNMKPLNVTNFEFFPSINLLGKEFYDVHSFRSVVEENYIKIYYNKEFGIVSFSELNGNKWVINK